jgi:hypothetical protein
MKACKQEKGSSDSLPSHFQILWKPVQTTRTVCRNRWWCAVIEWLIVCYFSSQTVCCYHSAGQLYGQTDVINACVSWLKHNLLLQQSADLLRDIRWVIQLLIQVVEWPDTANVCFCVLGVLLRSTHSIVRTSLTVYSCSLCWSVVCSRRYTNLGLADYFDIDR